MGRSTNRIRLLAQHTSPDGAVRAPAAAGTATPHPTPHSESFPDADDEPEAEAEEAAQMTSREKFLYDLQGFLVVKAALSAEEVGRLNAAFDANWEQRVPSVSGVRGGVGGSTNEFRGMCEWPQPHCQPFRELLVPKRLIGHLNTMFGRGWRQSGYVPFMITASNAQQGSRPPNPAVGGGIHGAGAAHFHPAMYYVRR